MSRTEFMLHEYGHAFDYAMGKGKPWSLSLNQFVKDDDAGHKERFAEAFQRIAQHGFDNAQYPGLQKIGKEKEFKDYIQTAVSSFAKGKQ